MKFLKKVINYFKRKYVFLMVNHFYAGTKKFSRKTKLLKSIGYSIGEGTKIVGPIYISANLIIGKNCWIGKNFEAQGNGKIIICDNCDIAPNVIINTGGHVVGDENRRAGEGIVNTITIGEGTWIGVRSTLINNISIGKGNVIAAGSVVIRSSDDNVLLAGCPAAVKKILK